MSISTVFLPQPTSALANFSYDTQVTYKVEADGSSTVIEDYIITNNTARQYLTEIKLSTPVSGLNHLKVQYDDGGVIPATNATKAAVRNDLSYDYQEIDINFPRQVYGLGKRWSFSLSYVATGLSENRGGGHTVYVPSIESGDAGDDYRVRVDVPESFGTAHFPGANSASAGKSGDRRYYNFSKSALSQKSLALVFGDSTVYKVNFNFPLKNEGSSPKTQTITLPPDLNSQHTVIASLNPKPNNTKVDVDGNILAEYQVPAKSNLVVTTDVQTEVKYTEYNLAASKKLADMPAELVKAYTKEGRYWHADSAITAEAKRLTDVNAPVATNVHAMYQYVIDKLTYNKNKIKLNYRQGAVKAFQNPTNVVCLEYADLLIAMLHSQGIPARMPVGYAYSGNLKTTDSVSDSLHSWVEAYVPGIGWMTLDPTWGEKFDNFGKSDMDHMAFAVWGQDDGAPGAVMVGGQETDYQYESANLSYLEKQFTPSVPASVLAKRFAVLPFLSIDHIQVMASSGVVTDGNSIKIGNTVYNLGSLGPSQVNTTNHLVLGLNWLAIGRVMFNHQVSGQMITVAESRLQLNYLPLVILAALLFGVIVLVVIRWWTLQQLSKENIPATEEGNSA